MSFENCEFSLSFSLSIFRIHVFLNFAKGEKEDRPCKLVTANPITRDALSVDLGVSKSNGLLLVPRLQNLSCLSVCGIRSDTGLISIRMHIRKGGNRVIGFSAMRERAGGRVVARVRENAVDEVLGFAAWGYGVTHGREGGKGGNSWSPGGGLRAWTSISGERRTHRRVARDSPAAFSERSARRTETAPESGRGQRHYRGCARGCGKTGGKLGESKTGR